MHNIKELRENLEIFKKKLSYRNFEFNVKEFDDLDKLNRKLINQKEKLEQEKKILSKSKDRSNFEKSKKISEQIIKLSDEQINTQKKLNQLLHLIPNLALDDVPVGKDEKSNKLIEQHGSIKKFSYKPKSHVDLGLKNKYIDFDTSIKLAGSRFVVLRDKIALLERALINFMLDIHTNEFNYTEISPPLIVNEDVMFGTGQLPKFEDDQFEIKFENSDQRKFLIPTAEVSLTNLLRKSLIQDDLPQRYVASTPCFRKEAGSYGRDTKGMMRQHQFYKVELVSIVQPENCISELERMVSCATDILKTGDTFSKYCFRREIWDLAEKTFDIEAWIPSENMYREISSCSLWVFSS